MTSKTDSPGCSKCNAQISTSLDKAPGQTLCETSGIVQLDDGLRQCFLPFMDQADCLECEGLFQPTPKTKQQTKTNRNEHYDNR